MPYILGYLVEQLDAEGQLRTYAAANKANLDSLLIRLGGYNHAHYEAHPLERKGVAILEGLHIYGASQP